MASQVAREAQAQLAQQAIQATMEHQDPPVHAVDREVRVKTRSTANARGNHEPWPKPKPMMIRDCFGIHASFVFMDALLPLLFEFRPLS